MAIENTSPILGGVGILGKVRIQDTRETVGSVGTRLGPGLFAKTLLLFMARGRMFCLLIMLSK